MSMQTIITAQNYYQELLRYLENLEIKRLMLVCGQAFENLKIKNFFDDVSLKGKIEIVRFSDFQPNPRYESIINGVQLFNRHNCDAIMAVGGGSAMDVAKCIKLYCNMDASINYLQQKIVPNNIPLIALPTTAGTGSEATRYAVIYYQGEKQSIVHESCIPQAVVVDPSVLISLPEYQRKATMLDALSHAVESYWSIHSTLESWSYSDEAIRVILENMDAYLNNDEHGNKMMLKAANLAGKAINITQTTAGHAMSYKLTSLYKIAHGHAVGLCLDQLWHFMIENQDKCIDPRGKEHLNNVFSRLAIAMNCDSASAAADCYTQILMSLKLPKIIMQKQDLKQLESSVNLTRLKNNPIELNVEEINYLYRKILE